MNKYLVRTLLAVGIISLVVLLPQSGLGQKQTADTTTTVTIKQSSTIPVLKPILQSETSHTITIRELDTKGTSVLQLNEEVTEKSVNSLIDQIKEANRNKVKAIYLLIDSPGGSVSDGARLITVMESSHVPVYTVCTELCASMAAHILEHGKERYMIDRTKVMFHPASVSAMVDGEVDKMYSRFADMKRFIDKLDMYVANRSGQKYEDYKAKTMREYWSDAEDALNDHLIDGIVTVDFVKNVIPDQNTGNNIKQMIKSLVWE